MSEYLLQLQELYGLSAAVPAAAAAAATTTSLNPPKVLDTRPQQQYLNHRLSYSVNVQLPSLTSNCYLLPDKSQPLAVIVPNSATYTITQELSQHGTPQDNGSTAVFLKGTASLQEFLTSRGWAAASFLQDCAELWQAAEQLQLLEQQPVDLQRLGKRCLFAPSQLLEAEVSSIELTLAALRMLEQRQGGQHQYISESSHHQQQQQVAGNGSCSNQNNVNGSSSQAVVPAAHVCLHALDVGCGSGRDVAWLASRQHCVQLSSSSCSSSSSIGIVTPSNGCENNQFKQQQQQQQQQQRTVHVSWHVTGVDEWLGALERAADLAAAMQLSAQQVQLVLGSICAQSGAMQLQHLPAKSRLRQAQHVSVLHAGSSEAVAAAAVAKQQPHAAAAEASAPAGALAAAVDGNAVSCSLKTMQYNLILCVRFLERSLLPQLRCLLKPGGYILYCTFVDGPGLRAFGRPSGHEHVLQPGELASLFGPQHGFQVLRDEVALSADGRELSWFVAQLSGST